MILKIVTPRLKACQGLSSRLVHPTGLCIAGSVLFHAAIAGILMRCTWASPSSKAREVCVRIVHLEPERPEAPAATPIAVIDFDERTTESMDLVEPRPLPLREEKLSESPRTPERPVLIACPSAPSRRKALAPTRFPVRAPAPLSTPSPSRTEERGGALDRDLQAAIEEYLRTVRRIIGENSVYPALARSEGLEGEVVVGVTLNGNGTIQEALVSRSSGSRLLDAAALKTVKRSAPFPPSPAAPAVCLRFTIPIVYNLEG